jgi:hypothetical protein
MIDSGDSAVAFDRNAGGHGWDFSTGVCGKCDMTREYYQDHGKPVPTARKPEKRERLRIEDDEQ